MPLFAFQYMGTLSYFYFFLFFIFMKEDNFCDFLFASLDHRALLKWDILLKKRIHSLISKFLLSLTLLHSEQPKLYGVLAFLSAIGLTL